ncbi:DNA repair exonuclease [Ancylobacter sp. A5.8]|uniref:metallophosphoesterase family protein n=1 Tax=Ancylobacter gelatini TaxID=2919920 RepID=UPI001F4DDFF7|nr:DNA repair exonuclease [Ancylobacter gelatini]MCJ8142209.1 DNA repair exonuclease [Ancylobacter gelatini]
MYRFIHSGDLHLGKRYGNMPEELRGRLKEARHTVLRRLADQARAQGASAILLAGDSFDTETPSPETRRQALAEMAHHAPLTWVLLPGNHDSLQAAQLWSALATGRPANVTLATEAAIHELAPGVALLPAPCTTRRPGRDLTQWMDGAATPEGTIRLGLAHAAILDFAEEGGASGIITPDRAARAGLDYLALGDWHGAMAIDARTHYSGTPEPDRFKHDRPGQALLVTLPAVGAPPEVTPLVTGSFEWRTIPLHLLAQDDGPARLAALLPPGPERRQSLLRIAATGRASLNARTALAAAIEHAAPEFALLELDDDRLETDCEAGDLDLIDRAGALREAAERLHAASLDTAASAAEREVARAALIRLFSLCQKIAS